MKIKLNKIIMLALFLIAAIILNSVFIYADEIGCCTNPGAGARLCYEQRFVSKDTECCPSKNENPSYYKSESNPFGPDDYNDCAANYFYANTACSLVSNCKTGCCCEPLRADVKTKAECKGTGVTFNEGTTDCEAVCAIPECSDGIDNDNNGCSDEDDTGCGAVYNPYDTSESGGICREELLGAGCNSESYVPKLLNLRIEPVRGGKKFSIIWTDECFANIIYYKISRCKGANCDNFELVGTSQISGFTDNSNNLLFGTNYSYQIKAHYSIQTAVPSVKGYGNLGDLECLGKEDAVKFCIHSFYYERYKNYLIENFNFNEDNFNEKVQASFGSKFNAPYYCNAENKLTSGGNKCTEDKLCVVESNTPKCLEKPVCSYEAANPFGLYYEQQLCENNKYCFYDRSFSIANNCFECSPAMSCYDYKSKESCERDNCKTGNCEWRTMYEELGTGVCISTIKDNCKWCVKTGTDGIGSKSVTSKVFEACTKEKAQKLSVPGYKCYFKGGIAKSCSDVVCADYGEEECSSTQIGINNLNKITNPSNDSCNIEVCQLFNDKCKKNADGNNEADCQNNECERDYFKPDTIITPLISKGVYESLVIQVFDKTSSASAATLKTSSDYKTYLCKNCSGSHPFGVSTNSYRLIISDLKVFDSTTGNLLLTLDEGSNTLRYYSQDPSKNIGLVRSIDVRAYKNSTGPKVYKVNITGATKIGDVYYTNNLKPDIAVEFYEEASITHAKLINNGNLKITEPSYSNQMRKQFTFEFSTVIGIGNYTFEINAKNRNNIYMGTYSLNMIIDDSALNLSIYPEKGALIKQENVPIRLRFDKKVNLVGILINNEDFTTYFSSDDNMVFTATLNLSDGNKIIKVSAKDYAGNEITASSDFVVNAHPLVIKLKEPPYGVSPFYTFDIIVETDNNANCKYSLTDNLEYEFMDRFGVTSGTEHKINNFNRIPDGSTDDYFFYVRCNDSIYGLGSAVFKLRVDTTPPLIKAAYAYPNPVIEKPPETKLKVETNEDTICKYSQTQTNYSLMEGRFPGFGTKNGFRTVHEQNLSLPETGSFTYYVGCENLAGLKSDIKSISFSINLNLSLVITDHTPEYSNSTTIILAVETNKNAQCKYSLKEDPEIFGTLFGPAGYTHVKTLTLSPGKHKYYVKCKDRYLEKWSDIKEIEFTIDTTEPVMEYVDDSSALENPEITWMTDRLRVKWLGKDDETGIHYYLYTLEEFGTLKTIINWTTNNIGGEWLWVSNLNLSNTVKYYFRAKAKNIVGLSSEVKESDGITIDINAKPTNCSNKEKDPSESDVDCGGACAPCEVGKKCSVNIDCKSSYCENNVCKAPTCNDNVKNQDESDVDCGGGVCNKCEDNRKCNQKSDCKSNYCGFGVCKTDTCYDGELSGSESDIDCGGACPTKCREGKSCSSDNECVAGTACVGSICAVCVANDADCNGVPDDKENDLDGDGMDDDWELMHGLDPNNANDALLDSDNDGLTNLEEFRYKTDPNKADTDGDKYNDKKEIDKGTDPLDPNDKPMSKIWIILIMLFGGFAVGIIGFVVYHRIVLKRRIELKPAMPMPRFVHKPIQPVRKGPTAEQIRQMRIREMEGKRAEERRKKREKMFEAFGAEKKEEVKEKEVKEVKEKPKVVKKVEKKKEIKKSKPDVFAKLSEIAKKPRKEAKTREIGKKGDAIKKLKKMAKKKKK